MWNRLSTALVASMALALSATAASAACAPKSSTGCVDLNMVPEISTQIVMDEQKSLPRTHVVSRDDASSQETYTGPTVGLSKMVRRAPTVGYRWSLE